MFSAVAGETPKQYTLRLRVSRGAALLLTSDQSVLDEALDDVARTPTSIEVDVVEDTLPGGPAATTVHAGSYETLSDAYGAVEAWMQSHGLPSAGAPWESYITDPTEHPDPRDWKTEVCWPVR
jgi:AraC family transcriptional regulator